MSLATRVPNGSQTSDDKDEPLAIGDHDNFVPVAEALCQRDRGSVAGEVGTDDHYPFAIHRDLLYWPRCDVTWSGTLSR